VQKIRSTHATSSKPLLDLREDDGLKLAPLPLAIRALSATQESHSVAKNIKINILAIYLPACFA
jgi:hypothetical protein